MAEITVQNSGADTYRVTVKAGTTTEHTVSLTDDYYRKLTGGKVTPETLIEKSFRFLLARESNTMILSRFDLPLIGSYFPQYESAIKDML